MKQFASESELCDYYLNELVVFNDPDDKEYLDEDTSEAYLDTDLVNEYIIFRAVANGEPSTYLKLYYETSRLEVIKIYAFNLTYKKQKYNAEKQYGR